MRMDTINSEFLNLVESLAKSEGLVFLGLSPLDVQEDYQQFERWLKSDYHGQMTWLGNHLDIRKDPSKILEGSTCALIFGYSYNLGDRWSRGDGNPFPQVAQYARLGDYHKFLKQKLTRVVDLLRQSISIDFSWRITVDSAPVLERALAKNTGTIFIGKNTCAIHPQFGSLLFLSEVFLTIPLAEELKEPPRLIDSTKRKLGEGGCGTCKRCQVNCPTDALSKDFQIDARKCLSYWTIEWQGEIPTEYWPWVGRYLFGCDICQLVCPYNRNQPVFEQTKSLERIQTPVDLHQMVFMDQQYYEKNFGGTPMTRAKIHGLRRNALIAIAMGQDHRKFEIIEKLKFDDHEVLRKTALTAEKILEKQKI